MNNKSIGKSSSLPASILNERTIFEKGEKNAKLDVGPTASIPGPMLFIVATTAVKLVVSASKPVPITAGSNDTKRRDTINIKTYTTI